MGVRDDLLRVAGSLAGDAATLTDADSGDADFDRAATRAADAKVALEAAALAENTSAGEIDQALERIRDLLADAGVIDAATTMRPEQFLTATFEALLNWRKEALRLAAYGHGYLRLRELAAKLERDFTTAGTETSMRLAGRIHTALDEAEQAVKQATEGGDDGEAGG